MRYRAKIGSCRRKLTSGRQALLVLVHLRTPAPRPAGSRLGGKPRLAQTRGSVRGGGAAVMDGGQVFSQRGEHCPQGSDPTLTEIGATHGKSVAQVVLRWLTQRNIVAIPKSVRPERMAQNLDVFGFTLTDGEMARIAALDTGATLFFDHRDPAMVSAIGNRPIHD